MICCKFSLHTMAFASEIDTYFIMKKHIKKTQLLLLLEGMTYETVFEKKRKLIGVNLVGYMQNSVKKKIFGYILKKVMGKAVV